MSKKSSPIARVLAAVALIAAVLLVYSVATGSIGGDDSGDDSNRAGKQNTQGGQKKQKPATKTYEVQPDDTLTGIAAANGVTVEQIQRLNPDLDPQALQAGQELKLRR